MPGEAKNGRGHRPPRPASESAHVDAKDDLFLKMSYPQQAGDPLMCVRCKLRGHWAIDCWSENNV